MATTHMTPPGRLLTVTDVNGTEPAEGRRMVYRLLVGFIGLRPDAGVRVPGWLYSTVTLLARLRGLSMSRPSLAAM
jgi:hypothetical protein